MLNNQFNAGGGVGGGMANKYNSNGFGAGNFGQ
jgi:hypothetical protein